MTTAPSVRRPPERAALATAHELGELAAMLGAGLALGGDVLESSAHQVIERLRHCIDELQAPAPEDPRAV